MNSFTEKLENIVYGDIGLCGCGDPEGVVSMIGDYLKLKKSQIYIDHDAIAEFVDKWDAHLMLFMMYILDEKEFTEHGSSVYGAWITEKGEQLLKAIEESKEEMQ